MSPFPQNYADQVTANRQPASGDDRLDVTAPYSTQITWDLDDRSQWPNVLTLWQPPEPRNTPTYQVGVMRYNGHVVLDTSGSSIRDFRIPLTISSRIEGLRIEAWMRADDRLTLGDIVSRMWTKGGPGGTKVPSFDRRALSKRASLARCRVGIISWLPKKGRDEHTAFMDSLRTPEQRANNKATDRDLTTEEKNAYAIIGEDVDKPSNAATRRTMEASGEDDTVAGSSSAAANVVPADPATAASSEDDNAMNVDSSSDEAESEKPAQEQASGNDSDDEGSLASSLVDPFDSRHEEPTNFQERDLLRRALEITVEHFEFMTGQQPEQTNPNDNYFSQLGMLQGQLSGLWAAMGNTTVAPKLRARGRWTDGISQFEFAEIDEGG